MRPTTTRHENERRDDDTLRERYCVLTKIYCKIGLQFNYLPIQSYLNVVWVLK